MEPLGKEKKEKKHHHHKKEKKHEIVCEKPQVIRLNPPVVPPPFPLPAYGHLTIDTANHVLYVGGQQGFLPDDTLPPTVAERVQQAFDNMFNIAAFGGAKKTDLLRLDIHINPDSQVAIDDFPGLDFWGRFNAIRDLANAVQEPIFGNNAPSRTFVSVTGLVLDDVFEATGIFLQSSILQPQCRCSCRDKKDKHDKKKHDKKHDKKEKKKHDKKKDRKGKKYESSSEDESSSNSASTLSSIKSH